ncbi:N-acetylmuramoyl-L-alanine amidase [Vibrio phage 1.232.O._10N.261.51.E11]|nr:N-acetylmuramoyl-L-alanine amidase [Vibrio phage 1.232.O._10N.261.51.E11]
MNPKFITVHCSATRPKHNFSVDALRDLHVNKNGWSDIGYHFYITADGTVNLCRPLTRNGAHVKGHNTDNIGICLEGGLNNDTGKPDDTYNHNQRAALKALVKKLQHEHGISQENVKGHRDWYGDANGDGVIDRHDWLKACPCFDVKKEIARW